MKTSHTVRSLLLSMLVAVGTVATPAFAQVNVNVRVAPPVPLYETVPMMEPGYVWAPGYWAWHGDHHIWIRGRTMVQRDGYRWAPDSWEQRGPVYYRHPGQWQRDATYRVVKVKKDKKPRHWNNGGGKNGKHGKGGKQDR